MRANPQSEIRTPQLETAQVPVPTPQETLNLSVFGQSKKLANHSAHATYKNQLAKNDLQLERFPPPHHSPTHHSPTHSPPTRLLTPCPPRTSSPQLERTPISQLKAASPLTILIP